MAKIQSPVWNSARGSVAGCTYLTTPSGQIIARARTKPVNPQTTKQSYIRGSLSKAVIDWEALPLPTRDDWNLWALTQGSTFHGREMFIAALTLGRYMNKLGGVTTVIRTEVPQFNGTPYTPFSVIDYTGEVGTTGLSLRFDAIPVLTNILVQVSPPMNHARRRYTGPWNTNNNFVAALSKTVATTVNISGLVLDAHYFVRIQFITTDVEEGLKGTVAGTHYIVDGYAAQGE